jgi:hypothetical protein
MRRSRARRYRRTNVVVLAISVYALAASIWVPPELMAEGPRATVLNPMWLRWGAYGAGGVSGLAAVFLSVRYPGLGRVLTLVAGVLLLSGFLALARATPLAVASLGLTGLALVVASGFMGPMPTPEQEGMPR